MGELMQEVDPWEVGTSLMYSNVPELVEKWQNQLEGRGVHQNLIVQELYKSPIRHYINAVFFTGSHGREIIGWNNAIFKPLAFAIIEDWPLKWHKLDEQGEKILNKHIASSEE
jgi:hypothetical protein